MFISKNLVQFLVFNPYYTINIQVIRNDLPCSIKLFDKFNTKNSSIRINIIGKYIIVNIKRLEMRITLQKI